MKTAIIYKSIHHGNTKKIAETIAGSLNADIFDLKEAKEDIIKDYDLIGFGSGIYFSKPHKKLMKFIDSLSDEKTKKAFVFSTSGKEKSEFNDLLKNELSRKGFEVIGEFNCKGFDTWGPLKLIGGLNKGKPNEEDFINAKKFAESLKEEIK